MFVFQYMMSHLIGLCPFQSCSMSSNEESSNSDTSSEGPGMVNLAKAAVVLRRLKGLLAQQSPAVNPPCPIPKLTGMQWMELTLDNPTKCIDNLHMSRDAFMHLHNMLLPFGLPSTDKCNSVEALGMYVWTCAHQSTSIECKYRF